MHTLRPASLRSIGPRSRGLRSLGLRALVVAAATTLLCSLGPAEPIARARVAVCFAPGTPLETVDEMKSQVALFQADDDARWSFTATDGGGLRRGEATTITWSIVPDGTNIPGYVGESASNSNLRSWLNARYGGQSNWLRLFEDVFDRWAAVSGVTYVYEPQDDGRTLGTASGSRGVRGDIRIGGHRIDGNSGTLAYNFFPDDGDMVLDTSDSFFSNTSNDSRRLRNVISHEHGHGLGLDHVCPVNGTKLMEPTASTSLDGPQLDDVLAAQRLYGDRFEADEFDGSPVSLGALARGDTVIDEVSIDGSDDEDRFSFELPADARLDVTLTPVGSTYAQGAQRFNGSCSSGSSFDALRRVDLRLDVLRPDGVTPIATADAFPAGGAERLFDLQTGEPGAHVVRVRGSGADEVQLYRLTLSVHALEVGPSAVADVQSTAEDVPLTIDVLANDTIPDGAAVSVRIANPPAHGTVTLRDGDRIRYVPPRDFAGDDEFAYELSDREGTSSTATVSIAVERAANAGDARFDADDDAYPDEVETLSGSSPTSATSRPATSAPGALLPLKSTAIVRFNKRSKDELVLRGILPLDASFVRDGAEVALYVGGAYRRFTLNKKGRGKSGRDALRLSRPTDSGAAFKLRLRNADLVSRWDDEGVLLESGVKREYRELSLFVIVDTAAFESALPLSYSVRRKRGKTTILKD